METFPYTTVTSKLPKLLVKIQEVSKPDIVDRKWLESIGFKGSNDYTLISVLKGIGFVDQNGKTTERWQEYRNKSRAGRVLAEAIRDGYKQVFDVYSDAHTRTDMEISDLVAAKTGMAKRSIEAIVSTFRCLVGLADFNSTEMELELPTVEACDVASKKVLPPAMDRGITVNVNIQLTVPATDDESVYEKFFTALRKHLLEQQ
ncbi:MAG TPA: DUF5343 domain-containing protein [Firmicutes bacterium]|nr:DUF5343 domain-containing protein [Candidatus Fermentithermobacillaceae bacterium]